MTEPPQNTFVEPSWHLTIEPIILIILLAISIRYDPLMPLFLKELPGTMTWHGYAKVIVKALLYLQPFGFSKGDLGPEVKIPITNPARVGP